MKVPKHSLICEELRRAITRGEYSEGNRLPSENALVRRFGASRPTVARALRDLQYEGLVQRRAGSGSFVRSKSEERENLFGLLLPGFGNNEFFEPICREISLRSQEHHHGLLWGNARLEALRVEEQAEILCEQYVARRVPGVFFAPLEFTPKKDVVNQRIVDAFERAGTALVLLDRCILEYPRRSRFDLVGIDNRRAGYVITKHLLDAGTDRVAFVARPNSAWTVDARLAGYREALWNRGIAADPTWARFGDPADNAFVTGLLREARPQGIVCANDHTAGHLMHTLHGLGVRVPDDVRIVGIDDANYASLLRVPLTTLQQPCRQIGAAAVKTMIERIAEPHLPARDILFDFQLVVRESCGVKGRQAATEAS